jgi:hypothetical protein
MIASIVQQAYRHYIPRMGKPPGPMLDDYAVRVRERAAVAPERQGLGIGRRLLDFAEAEALRRGYREIRLYTHETMIENQRLYSALGYEETGRATQAGYDRVFMCKQLDSVGALLHGSVAWRRGVDGIGGAGPPDPGQLPCHSKRTKIAVITFRSSGTE